MRIPLEFSEATGGVVGAEGLEKVQSDIFFVLSTRKGEYFMHPEFGSNLMGMIHEIWSPATKSRLELEVAQALEQWVPKIQLLQISANRHATDIYRIDVVGVYQIRNTSIQGSFVYPFSTQSGPLS